MFSLFEYYIEQLFYFNFLMKRQHDFYKKKSYLLKLCRAEFKVDKEEDAATMRKKKKR